MNSAEQQSVLEVLTEVDRLFKMDRIKDGDRWSYGLVYPHTFIPLIPRIEKLINSLNKDLGNE
jgi:hypothetical protein